MTTTIRPIVGKMSRPPFVVFGLTADLVLPGLTKNPPQPNRLKYSGTAPGSDTAQFLWLEIALNFLGFYLGFNILSTTGDYDARAATADKRAATKAAKAQKPV
jgi:hypothetical protein